MNGTTGLERKRFSRDPRQLQATYNLQQSNLDVDFITVTGDGVQRRDGSVSTIRDPPGNINMSLHNTLVPTNEFERQIFPSMT